MLFSPILASPDFNKPFVLQTDMSKYGVGAILSQRDKHGRDHPAAYFRLLPREKCGTPQDNCLVVVAGVDVIIRTIFLCDNCFIAVISRCPPC